MEYNTTTPPRDPKPQPEDNALTLKDIWALCINHWKWFVLSLAVCLGVAAFKIIKTVPVYTRSASVLIKEDRKSGTVSGDVSSAFSGLGMGMSRVNVYNEIINFTSPDLMLQVAKNLHLDVDYKVKGLRYKYTLYGSGLPIQVEFLDPGRSGYGGLAVERKDSATVLLGSFTFRPPTVTRPKRPWARSASPAPRTPTKPAGTVPSWSPDRACRAPRAPAAAASRLRSTASIPPSST